jgi:protein involved in polysaccharide export with SLBB domain
VISVLTCIAFGCAAPRRPEPRAFRQAPPETIELAAERVEFPSYRFGVGDEMEITFALPKSRAARPEPPPHDDRLRIGDEIVLRFPYHLPYDQTCTVAADGTIPPRDLDPIPAAGKLPDELKARLLTAYARYLREPRIEMHVNRAAAPVEAAAPSASPMESDSHTQHAVVRPDGMIDVPGGQVRAFGRTTEDVTAAVRVALTAALDAEIHVHIRVVRVAPCRVFMGGAVERAHMLLLDRPATLSQAIIAAGGPTLDADLRAVTLTRRAGLSTPESMAINLEGVFNRTDDVPAEASPLDPWLAEGDVVVVPHQPPRGVRRLLPERRAP